MIILYYNFSQGGPLINDPLPNLPNLFGQFFESTF